MNRKVRKKKMYPILFGLILFFITLSVVSATNSVDKTIQCPFESIDEKHSIIDSTPDPFEGKISQIIENLGLITPFTTRSYTLMGGEGINLLLPNTIRYSSTQHTVPETIVDMQIQTGLQKKNGVNWDLVASKSAVRDTTDELSQSGLYVASPGTYRTIGCHKVWEGGVLVLHVDSWTAGELTIS